MDQLEILREQTKKIIDTADENVLKMVYALLEDKAERKWWDELPESVRRDVDEALIESKHRKGIPHEEVKKKYTQWFTK